MLFYVCLYILSFSYLPLFDDQQFSNLLKNKNRKKINDNENHFQTEEEMLILVDFPK